MKGRLSWWTCRATVGGLVLHSAIPIEFIHCFVSLISLIPQRQFIQVQLNCFIPFVCLLAPLISSFSLCGCSLSLAEPLAGQPAHNPPKEESRERRNQSNYAMSLIWIWFVFVFSFRRSHCRQAGHNPLKKRKTNQIHQTRQLHWKSKIFKLRCRRLLRPLHQHQSILPILKEKNGIGLLISFFRRVNKLNIHKSKKFLSMFHV